MARGGNGCTGRGRSEGIGRGRGRSEGVGRGATGTVGRRDSEADVMSMSIETPLSTGFEHQTPALNDNTVGSNLAQQVPVGASKRIFIVPWREKFTDPKVGKEIISILKTMFNGSWTRWTDVPESHRTKMWERFQRTYEWNPSLTEVVRKHWKIILQNRYRDVMSEAREYAFNKAADRGVVVGDNLSLLKPFFPEWIDEANWADMIDNDWNTDKWKRVSLAGKRSRCTKVDGQMSAHSGGSLSFDHHELRMIEENNGDPVSKVKVYKRTHREKGLALGDEESGSVTTGYITLKAGSVMDAYIEGTFEKFGPNPDNHPLEIDREIWEKCTGGIKKGNWFGISKDAMGTSRMPNTCGQTGVELNDEVQRLQQQLEDQKIETQKLKEEAELRETKLTELEERDRLRELQLKKMSEQMAAFEKRFPPSN